VKNHEIASYSTTAEARDKMKPDFESLEIYNFYVAGCTKFKNNQNLLNKKLFLISSDNSAIFWVKYPH
jgi:hypothetical protein